jgi:hypothetical protein
MIKNIGKAFQGFFVSDRQAWEKALTENSQVEVMDVRDHNWYPCTIVVVSDDAGTVLIHYNSYNSKYDEVLSKASPRMAPLGTQQKLRKQQEQRQQQQRQQERERQRQRQWQQQQQQQQRQMRISKQVKLEKTVTIEAFKEQINQLFSSFSSFTAMRNNKQMTADDLVLVNELIVQLLNMFGTSCSSYKKKNEDREVLIVGSSHFNDRKSKLSESDATLLRKFLRYMEVAMTTDQKLAMMPLLKETADNERENFTAENMNEMMGDFMGARHGYAKKQQHWEDNSEAFHEQQQRDIRSHKKQYNQKRSQKNRQKMQQPAANELFEASNASQTVVFGRTKNYTEEANVLSDIFPDCNDNNSKSNNNSNSHSNGNYNNSNSVNNNAMMEADLLGIGIYENEGSSGSENSGSSPANSCDVAMKSMNNNTGKKHDHNNSQCNHSHHSHHHNGKTASANSNNNNSSKNRNRSNHSRARYY